MGRWGILVVVVAAELLSGASAFAQTPAQNGATWLLARQRADGTFGGATGTDLVLTTIEALQAVTPIVGATSPAVEMGRAFVRSTAPTEFDLGARRLALLDGNSLMDSLNAAVFRGAALSQGYAFESGDTAPTLLESAQAIAFLAADELLTAALSPPLVTTQTPVGCSQSSVICPLIAPYLTFLLTSQNPDGGWAFAGESSDLRLTAEILAVLMPLRNQLTIDAYLQQGVQFLLTQAGADGHFGLATPATADTALAILAMVGAPTPQAAAISAGIAYLTAHQLPDGSWDESELNTAFALRALRAQAANLQVTPTTQGTTSSVTVSTANPTSGSTEQVSVTIDNAGVSSSAPTTVVFSAVNASGQTIVLGTASVPAASGGGQVTVTTTVDTSGLSGSYQIVATIENQSSSAQTQASTPIQVISAYDLAISPSDIQFSPGDGGFENVSVTVHENGDAIPAAFAIGIFQGDPDGGGGLIGAPTVASIAAGGSATVSVPWSMKTANGLTPIFAVADPGDLVVDANRANNVAVNYYSAPDAGTDLAILTNGVVVPSLVFHANTPGTVDVYVNNLSGVDAYNVPVGLCAHGNDSTPYTFIPGCPSQMGTVDVVPAHGSGRVSFTIPASEIAIQYGATLGNLYATAIVDPFNTLADPNRSNNAGYASVEITTGVALTSNVYVSCDGSWRATLLEGTMLVLGATAPVLVPYLIYAGDPAHGGAIIGEGQLSTDIHGAVGFSLPIPPQPPNTLIVFVPDPQNALNNVLPYLAQASSACAPVRSDLRLSYQDISFSPVGPSVGETSAVSVAVWNAGPVASTSTLDVFVGDPAAIGAVRIGEFPVSIAPSGTQIVKFPWTRSGEQTNLFFRLDNTLPVEAYQIDYNSPGPSGEDSTPIFAQRNAFIESIYTSGRKNAWGTSPWNSPPSIGDLLRTGRPVIGYGEALEFFDAGSIDDFAGRLVLVQQQPDMSIRDVWTKQVDRGVGQPVFVDLGGGAGPQVVFLSVVGDHYSPNYAGRGNTIHVWNPDSSIAWERTYVLGPDGGPGDACMNEANLFAPGVGDVNGDGVADIIFPTADSVLHVLDGRTGNPIWETQLPPNVYCASRPGGPAGGGYYGWQPTVVDIDGDGKNEVILSTFNQPNGDYGNVFIFSSTGQCLEGDGGGVFFTGSAQALDVNGNLAVVAPGGIGTAPALISTSLYAAQAVFADGGIAWTWVDTLHYPAYLPFQGPFASDVDLCGIPQTFMGSTGGPVALSVDGGVLWYGDLGGGDGEPYSYYATPMISRAVVAADLLGLGTPQYIGSANNDEFFVLDGRTGATILKSHVPLADWGNADDEAEFYDPAIADVGGDGRGRVVINNSGDRTDGLGGAFGYEWNSSLVIYDSQNHWKPMPTVWSGNQYHHQFNEDLTLSADAYKPWTTHNTWRTQFMTSAITPLPDLKLLQPDAGSEITVTPAPLGAGTTATVSVPVHNYGGTAVTNVAVALYVGDPTNGGSLAATSVVAGPIASCGGVAPATFSWDAWPEGFDQLFVVVNPPLPDGGRAITEAGYENNTASTRVFVGGGTTLADLAISPSDLVFSPPSAVAGTPVSIAVTVHNLGTVAAGAFVVTLNDGVGGTGLPIASLPVAGLQVGQATTVTASGWLPTEGTHFVTAVADPAQVVPDSNLGNNTAVATYVSGQSALPDLQISAPDLVLSPSATVEAGQPVTLTSTIHNYGAPVGNVPVLITIDGAIQLASTVLQPTIGTGVAVPVVTQINTAALSGGPHLISVQIDPNATIREYSPANKQAQIMLTAQGVVASVVVTTDKPSYTANAPVSVATQLTSVVLTAATYLLNVQIEDALGTPQVSLASNWQETLGPGVGQTLSFAWNTGAAVPGSYSALATLTDPVTRLVVASGSAAFTVAADDTFALATAPLLQAYQPGSTAIVVTHVIDRSQNLALANATLTVSVATPLGAPLYSATRKGVSVPRGQDLQALDSVGLSLTSPPGNYPIAATLSDASGTQLAAASGTLVVQPASVATGLSAQITATPGTVPVGEAVTLSATITDVGNASYGAQTVDLEVGNPTTQAILATFGTTQSLSPGQTVSLSDLYGTTGLVPGDYLAAVVVAGTPLAHTVLHASPEAPPTVVISGVTNGELTNQTVTPVITVSAMTATYTLTATLNGQPFASGTPVTTDGAFTLTATAVDALGSSAAVSVAFTLDKTPPAIAVAGVANGQVTNAASVTPVISVSDLHLDPSQTVVLLNGASFVSGTPIAAEGTYVLTVAAGDLAGNKATASISFAIDRTPPRIAVTGVTNNACTAQAVTPVVTITDANPNPSATVATLNGQPFTSGTAIAGSGQFTLVVTATDLAGNSSSQTVDFTLNQTPPAVTLGGILAGQITNALSVTPTVSVADAAAIVSETATLNRLAYAVGAPVTAEGDYVLSVTATDCAGLTGSASVSFGIDRTPPAIAIGGVTSGECTVGPVAPTVSVTDAHLASVTATLNGAPFVSGTSISAAGSYTLSVAASDLAGNQSTTSVSFQLAPAAPSVSIAGVTNGLFTSASSVIPVVTVSGVATSQSATLNGAPYGSGIAVTAEGSYTLTATATNCAGLTGNATVSFTIDRTPPAIAITGVASGACTAGPIAAQVSVTDANPNPAKTVITLNGAPYASGAPIVASGHYALQVTAQDLAGNTASQSLSFTVDAAAPTISIAGVTANEIVNVAQLTPTVTISDLGTLTTQTVTLNGAPYVSGTPLTAENDYALAVLATNCGGLSATASDQFAIDRTPPTIAISGVTSGEISASPVTPVVTVTDKHPGPTTITLNGAAFTSGTTISAGGSYTLSVISTDLAGNQAAQSATFTIRRVPTFALGLCGGQANLSGAARIVAQGACTPSSDSSWVWNDGSNLGNWCQNDQAEEEWHGLGRGGGLQGPGFQGFHRPDGVSGRDWGHGRPGSSDAGADAGIPELVGLSGDLDGTDSSFIGGSAVVGGNLDLTCHAEIEGPVYLFGSETLARGASTGPVTKLSVAPSPCCPFDAISAMGGIKAQNDNASLSGTSVGKLIDDGGAFVDTSGSVTWPSGIYYLTGLTLSDCAQVSLPPGDGGVQLWVDGPVRLSDQSALLGSAANPSSLLIVSSGSLALSDDANAVGLFYAAGSVSLSDDASLLGAVSGSQLTFSDDATLVVATPYLISGEQLSCP